MTVIAHSHVRCDFCDRGRSLSRLSRFRRLNLSIQFSKNRRCSFERRVGNHMPEPIGCQAFSPTFFADHLRALKALETTKTLARSWVTRHRPGHLALAEKLLDPRAWNRSLARLGIPRRLSPWGSGLWLNQVFVSTLFFVFLGDRVADAFRSPSQRARRRREANLRPNPLGCQPHTEDFF